MSDPFVIVGGDAAGLSAASKCRREDPDRDVIVFERDAWVSFAHCGMPYYVKGDVGEIERLLSLSPDDIDDRGIKLRRFHEVVGVDTDAETVTVETDSEQFEQPYGDLLLATGATAVTDPIEGSELYGAFTIHHLDDAAAVRAFVLSKDEAQKIPAESEHLDPEYVRSYANRDRPETAAIIGGGYVGVEMAEALSAHDLDVHLFQRSGHVLPPFGPDAAGRVEETLTEEEEVTIHTNTTVEAIRGDDQVEAVAHDGGVLDVDLAIVGVGIKPNVEFVPNAIERGETGAIATDEYGETSVDGVYAAGDCAESRHAVTGDPDWVPLGLTANRGGRAIGATVAGDPTPTGTIAGTAVVKAFDMEAGRAGFVDPDRASDAGFTPVAETVTARSRSGYYPGAEPTTVTLLADKESGLLLGGAIAGRDRAAKRIDTIATALEAGMTVGELERLDLSYAPPFSPVWDPLLVGAKVLNGKLE